MNKKRERDYTVDTEDVRKYYREQFNETRVYDTDDEYDFTDPQFTFTKKVKKTVRRYVKNKLAELGLAYVEMFKYLTLTYKTDWYKYKIDENGFYYEEEIEVYEADNETSYDRWNRLRYDMLNSVRITKKEKDDENKKNEQLDFFGQSEDGPSFFGAVKFKLIDWFVKLIRYRQSISWISLGTSLGLMGVGYFSGLNSLVAYGGNLFAYSGLYSFIAGIINDLFIQQLGPREIIRKYDLKRIIIDIMVKVYPIILLNRFRGIRDVVGAPVGVEMRNDRGIVALVLRMIAYFEYWLNPGRFIFRPDEIRDRFREQIGFGHVNYMDLIRRIYRVNDGLDGIAARYDNILGDERLQGIIQQNENILGRDVINLDEDGEMNNQELGFVINFIDNYFRNRRANFLNEYRNRFANMPLDNLNNVVQDNDPFE